MRNRNWVFGKNAALSFNPNPVASATPPVSTSEGCASISDQSGNLILYSDGITVRDGSGTLRASGLPGHQSSTQAALIVPDPGNKRRYYVFTSDGASGGNNHLGGIRIDTGSWAVVPIASLMTMPPTAGLSPTEKLTAVLHANKQDFWILTVVQDQLQPGYLANGEVGRGFLRVFQVTPSGVSFVGDRPLEQLVGDVGYMKASRNGRHLALANMWLSNVLVIAFSNATAMISLSGIVTIPVKVPPFNTNGFPLGVEFSPSGKLLYYSTLFPLPIAASLGHVFQYALSSGPPVLVGTHPNDKAGDFALGALQLGSDARIYIAQDGEKKLGVIAQPDNAGAACGLSFGALPLAAASTCNSGLPNLIRDLF